MLRSVMAAVAVAGALSMSFNALAQTAPVAAQPAVPKASAPSANAPKTAAAARTVAGPAIKTKSPTSGTCIRLPLSDVAFGTEGATKYAREKLDEYAQAETKKRKWAAKPLVKSNETVSCEVYLNLGPLGTEYRCLVTATFCQK
jgi:hypothetical protein